MSEYCVSCGEEIPEGSMLCFYCEKKERTGRTDAIPYYCKKIKIKNNKTRKKEKVTG